MIKIGAKVRMNNKYHVSEENRGKVWTVRSEPWLCSGQMVVKLEGKSGGYAVDGLDPVGCNGCAHDLGGGCCKINEEAECREGGGFELWEPKEAER